jgi:hypothetical protein
METLSKFAIIALLLVAVTMGTGHHLHPQYDPAAMSQKVAHVDDSPAMCHQHGGTIQWTEIDGKQYFSGCSHGNVVGVTTP